MRKLLFALGFCLLYQSASAETTKTVFNPFTGKLDYITKVTSTTLGTDAGLTANQCVQTDANGALSTSGSTCGAGGGGGGSSSLETLFGTARSSPTATLAGNQSQFTGAVNGSTMTFSLNSSSVTLQGNGPFSSTLLTNSILNQNTLQAGATAYPDFVYVGTSATVNGPISVNKITTNLISATTGYFTASNLSYSRPLAGVSIGGPSGTQTNYGVFGNATNYNAGTAYGGYFESWNLPNPNTATIYGISGYASAGLINYGVSGIADNGKASGGINYGLYGSASGATNNYGLFIAAGQSQINSSATITGAGGLGVIYGATVGSMTVSNLTSGQCVQAGTGGLLTVTGSACGSGGGGPTLIATQTWSGQNNWTTPLPSTFTYGVVAGSITVNGPGDGSIILTIGNSTYSVTSSSVIPVVGQFAVASSTSGTVQWITSGGGGGGTPASPVNSVQYNNGGSFGGSNNFQWNGTSMTIISSVTITSNGLSNTTPGFLDVYRDNIANTAGTSLFTVGSVNQPNQFNLLDQTAVDMIRYGSNSGHLRIGQLGNTIDQRVHTDQANGQYVDFWNGGRMDLRTDTSGNGGLDIVLLPQTVEALRVSNTGGVIATSSATVLGAGGLGVTYGAILGSATISNLASGQCVQTGTGGLLTVTGSACSSGGGTPSGPTNSVQFNNSGSFGGSGNFNWSGTSVSVLGAGGIQNTYGLTTSTEYLKSGVGGVGGQLSIWNSGGNNRQIEFDTDAGAFMGQINALSSGYFRIDDETLGPFALQTGGTERMRIDYAGSVVVDSSMSVQGAGGLGSNFGVIASSLVLVNATSPTTLFVSTATSGVAQLAVSSSIAKAPSDFILTVSSSDGTMIFGINNAGNLISSGTAPSITSCGTSPSVVGNNISGQITVGGGVVTACTLNFANGGFGAAPICVPSDNSSTVAVSNGATSTTSAVFNLSATLGGGLINYICIGVQK